MNRLIRAYDKVAASENAHPGIRGMVIFGRGKHVVPFKDPYGNESYRTVFDEIVSVEPNIVPIGGYQFAFSKLFNIALDQDSTLRVGDLNDEAPQMNIGVPRAEYQSPLYNAEVSTKGDAPTNAGVNISAMNYIFGFMMGDGGAKEDNMTAIAPNYKDRTLFRAIPFRMSNDGTPIDQKKYFGRAVTGIGSTAMDPVTSYYVKLFDTPRPHIVHSWVSDDPNELRIVDDSVFSSTSSDAIESYVEMNISVDGYDGRGYHAAMNTAPRVNEFALVSGWYNREKNDYEMLRIFTHFTRPSITLMEGDSISALYRLYAR